MFKILPLCALAALFAACGGDDACAMRTGTYKMTFSAPTSADCPPIGDQTLLADGSMGTPQAGCTDSNVKSSDHCTADTQRTCADGSRTNGHFVWSKDGSSGTGTFVITVAAGPTCSYSVTAIKL